jgi:hypothetical protein
LQWNAATECNFIFGLGGGITLHWVAELIAFSTVAPVSTIQALFPQKKGITTDAFQADHEYLMNQRRRNLPVGESRQRPSGEPATGLEKHSGNWMLWMEPRNLLQRMRWRKSMGSSGSARSHQTILKFALSCDLAPNRVFEKSESRGRVLEGEFVPFAFLNSLLPKADTDRAFAKEAPVGLS